jgi:hypothetical protein
LLRLTDVKLPLGHEEGALKSAILGRLKIPPRDLVGFSVFRRATDARKRSAIALTYSWTSRSRTKRRCSRASPRTATSRVRPI